jgi:hypothetical protein
MVDPKCRIVDLVCSRVQLFGGMPMTKLWLASQLPVGRSSWRSPTHPPARPGVRTPCGPYVAADRQVGCGLPALLLAPNSRAGVSPGPAAG